MFQHFRPGNATLFGNVPHQHHCRTGFFGSANNHITTVGNLTDRTWRRGDFIKTEGLNRVNDNQLVRAGTNRRGDIISTGAGYKMELLAGVGTETLGAQLHLRGRFLATGV